MTKVYLTDRQVERLAVMLRDYEDGALQIRTSHPAFAPEERTEIFTVKTTKDVPALAGLVPGQGTATFESYNGMSLLDKSVTSLQDVTVYNFSTSLISNGTFCGAYRDPYGSGAWFLLVGGGGNQVLEGQLSSDLQAGKTATMNVYTVTNGVWTFTNQGLTVTDRAGWSGSLGQYVMVVLINGEYRVVQVGCGT